MLPDTSRAKVERSIRITGCDDSNEFALLLTEDEAALVQRLAEASAAASQYGCQPVLRLLDRALAAGAA